MAEYRISVEGSTATGTVPSEGRALHSAEEIARGFSRAYPGQVVTLEKRRGRSVGWELESYWRGEQVTRIEARNIGRNVR